MNITGGGVSDLALNSALHGTSFTISNIYMRRRKDTMLEHSPSEVLNYADARSGHVRIDYASFGLQFRHNWDSTLSVLYADGSASGFSWGQQVITPSLYNRGANNTTWNPLRPYYWW
jgi:hypothetical protein